MNVRESVFGSEMVLFVFLGGSASSFQLFSSNAYKLSLNSLVVKRDCLERCDNDGL